MEESEAGSAVREWSDWGNLYYGYGALLRAFVDERVTGDEFEAIFLDLFRWDVSYGRGEDHRDPEVVEIIEYLFYDVDTYANAPGIPGIPTMDATELRSRAKAAYESIAAKMNEL